MSELSNSTEVTVHVGEAWSQHYKGQNEEALAKFQEIVANAPDHIDANYGLALCLKTAGQKVEAIQAFEKTKQLTQAEIEQQGEEEDKTRFQMLSRIIDQHLSRLK